MYIKNPKPTTTIGVAGEMAAKSYLEVQEGECQRLP